MRRYSDDTKREIGIEFLMNPFDSGADSFETNPKFQLNLNPSTVFHIRRVEIAPEHTGWIGEPPVADIVSTSLVDWIRFTPYGYEQN